MDSSAAAPRMRQDIVRAAISCWSIDSSRSLSTIAATAGLSRSTLHRHFAGRAELIVAVDRECQRQFLAAATQARPGDGSGLAALCRLGTELIGLGPVLGLVFADNALVDPDTWTSGAQDDGRDDPVTRLVQRGLLDGSIDARLPTTWITTLAWTTLFAAWLSISSGAMTVHEAGSLYSRSLAAAVTATSTAQSVD